MRLAKPFHVVCTWRFWQQHSYLWIHLILQVCWEMCCQRGLWASRSAACVVICPFLRVLVLPWRSLRKSLTAQELCCNCDPKILMYWCNYWIQRSCSCDHHIELCLHSCSCSLTPSVALGESQQLWWREEQPCSPVFLSASASSLLASFSHSVQPTNSQKLTLLSRFSALLLKYPFREQTDANVRGKGQGSEDAGRWTFVMVWQTVSWPELSPEAKSENLSKGVTALKKHCQCQNFLPHVATSWILTIWLVL